MQVNVIRNLAPTLLSTTVHRAETFASVAASIAKLPDRTVLLDGEVVAFDSK